MFFPKLIYLLISTTLLSSCARAQGATAPAGVIDSYTNLNYANSTNDQVGVDQVGIDQGLLPQVEAASLEPIINYIDALNWALAGDLSKLKQAAHPDCGCLEISKRLESLFTTASLTGGGYRLINIAIASDTSNKKIFDVVINRSELIKVDKQGGVRSIWSASVIKNQFVVEKINLIWQLRQVL
jgi:hypothetical protein